MKIFYGWRIVAAGGALQFLQSLLLNQAFGAYVAVLVEERGWSKTALSGAAALKSTETALLGPIMGWMVDRFGAQGIIRAGIVMFGVGFMLLSQIDSLAGFYGPNARNMAESHRELLMAALGRESWDGTDQRLDLPSQN